MKNLHVITFLIPVLLLLLLHALFGQFWPWYVTLIIILAYFSAEILYIASTLDIDEIVAKKELALTKQPFFKRLWRALKAFAILEPGRKEMGFSLAVALAIITIIGIWRHMLHSNQGNESSFEFIVGHILIIAIISLSVFIIGIVRGRREFNWREELIFQSNLLTFLGIPILVAIGGFVINSILIQPPVKGDSISIYTVLFYVGIYFSGFYTALSLRWGLLRGLDDLFVHKLNITMNLLKTYEIVSDDKDFWNEVRKIQHASYINLLKDSLGIGEFKRDNVNNVPLMYYGLTFNLNSQMQRFIISGYLFRATCVGIIIFLLIRSVLWLHYFRGLNPIHSKKELKPPYAIHVEFSFLYTKVLYYRYLYSIIQIKWLNRHALKLILDFENRLSAFDSSILLDGKILGSKIELLHRYPENNLKQCCETIAKRRNLIKDHHYSEGHKRHLAYLCLYESDILSEYGLIGRSIVSAIEGYKNEPSCPLLCNRIIYLSIRLLLLNNSLSIESKQLLRACFRPLFQTIEGHNEPIINHGLVGRYYAPMARLFDTLGVSCLFLLNDLENAEKCFRISIRICSHPYPRAFFALIQLLKEKPNYDKALFFAHKVLESLKYDYERELYTIAYRIIGEVYKTPSEDERLDRKSLRSLFRQVYDTSLGLTEDKSTKIYTALKKLDQEPQENTIEEYLKYTIGSLHMILYPHVELSDDIKDIVNKIAREKYIPPKSKEKLDEEAEKATKEFIRRALNIQKRKLKLGYFLALSANRVASWTESRHKDQEALNNLSIAEDLIRSLDIDRDWDLNL